MAYLLALFISAFTLLGSAHALPIDWSGQLGFDTTLINNYRRTSEDVSKSVPNQGTQGIASGDDSAHFQTYVFRLMPQMIVNDAVTIKGELSTGHIRGGFLGDNSTTSEDNSGNRSYFATSPAQRSTLNVNQIYAELYADTALVKVGRFSRNFGLGAVINDGDDSWDRFFTMYDGIQGEVKIGNFSLIPHWARLSVYDDTNNKSQPNGGYDVRELGVSGSYHDKIKELFIGFTYGKRFSERRNSLYNSTQDASPQTFDRGKTEVTLIDVYLEKKWEKFQMALEVPMMTGEYGNIYDANTSSKVSATSIIFESIWHSSRNWDFGLNAGQIAGDDGDSDKFEGMYLHPNYQIADIMFRYNMSAFNEGGKSIFDSHIVNARYAKLFAHYMTDRWTWKMAAIWAKAQEVAKSNKKAYHHEEGYRFNASENQGDDLGYELDFGFDFQWNPNVVISGNLGYWFVGDYYSFTNTSDDLATKNVLATGLKVGINF